MRGTVDMNFLFTLGEVQRTVRAYADKQAARYGITRAGSRVKLDCVGSRCGYSDGSECSSESEDDYKRGTTRRHGIVVRH